jgi:hypothetical protein
VDEIRGQNRRKEEQKKTKGIEEKQSKRKHGPQEDFSPCFWSKLRDSQLRSSHEQANVVQ